VGRSAGKGWVRQCCSAVNIAPSQSLLKPLERGDSLRVMYVCVHVCVCVCVCVCGRLLQQPARGSNAIYKGERVG